MVEWSVQPTTPMKPRFIPVAFALLLCAAALAPSSLARDTAPSTPPVGLRLEVDRSVLPADSTERAVLKVCFDGLQPPRSDMRPPVNLAIVIDRSGSMEGDKIARAREAAIEAVQRLGADDLVSVIAYDDEARVLVPAQRRRDGRHIAEAIRCISAGGSTALYDGVFRGAAEVRRNLEDRRYVNRVILLSDGLANRGPSSPAELGRLGAALMREGISVTTIGLGLGFNEDLMTQLAQRSDGNTYFVENSDDLPRIFAAELGDVLSIVARRIVLEVRFPSHVKPLAFVGREGRIKGQEAQLTLNQLYGGQEKFALIEVEVGPARHGADRPLASATLEFEDAIHSRTARLTAEKSVGFSRELDATVRSANHQVQADYATNVLALAKDEAVVLADAGKRREAAERLRSQAENFKALGRTYSNSLVTGIAAPAAAEADAVEREGMDNAKRKQLRAESSGARAQQATPAVAR